MFTSQQLFLMVHLGLGALFIHAAAGGLATLTRPRPTRLQTMIRDSSVVAMAGVAWATVITGTWLVYPGYRAKPVAGADFEAYPRYWLMADHSTEFWHHFGMEWKEHVGWLVPFLATAVAFIVLRHRHAFTEDPKLRRITMWLFGLAVAASVVSAGLGAAINKVAPNQFLM
jgi:hypothetical protein